MNDIAIAFDYSLVDRDAEDRLKEIKGEITDITGNAGIQIGARLTEAQKLFSRRGKSGAEGGFLTWVENEVGVERRTAYNLINIYSRCLENNDLHMCANHFSKSIQARLAAPSTPDVVIEKAREIAESGETLTVAQVEEMKRKAKAEALAESEKEKADLKSKIALTESQKESWRKQAIEKEKARKAAEDAAVIKSNELRKLRESIEASANRIAEGKLSEIKATVSELEIGKIEMERKLKALRKEQDAQVETRTKQALQAQQDEINRREAQLRSMEARIETLRVTLSAVTEESRAVSHYEHITKEIRSTLDALSLHLTQAFDADYAAFMPAHFVHAFERLAGELDSGAKSVRSVLSQIEIRHIEGAINE